MRFISPNTIISFVSLEDGKGNSTFLNPSLDRSYCFLFADKMLVFFSPIHSILGKVKGDIPPLVFVILEDGCPLRSLLYSRVTRFLRAL